MKSLDFGSGITSHPVRNTLFQRWVHTVIWCWVTILVSADLKVSVNPYIHWVVSGFALFLILPAVLRPRYRIHPWSAASACVLLFSVVLSSFRSSNPLYDLGQMAKLGMLLIVTPALFNSVEGAAKVGFNAFVSSAYINVGLLFMGSTFHFTLAGDMAAGRWGTWLNHPGSLWKVGIVTLVYAAYCTVLSGFKSLPNIALLLTSLVVIYFDSSRTALLLVPVGVLYLLVITWTDGRRRIIRTLIGACAVIAIGLSLTGTWSGSQSAPALNLAGGDRFTAFVQAVSGGSNGLVDADATRANMLRDAFNAIKDHPLMGTGISATKSETETGLMVVHNAYLQVWADLGVLGFIGYVSLVLGWITIVPRVLPKIRRLPTVHERGLYYNAIFLLIYFAISGLFHPLSTEWSEWVTFCVPHALLLGIARSEPPEVAHG